MMNSQTDLFALQAISANSRKIQKKQADGSSRAPLMRFALAPTLLALLTLTACSSAPVLQSPKLVAPAAFKEATLDAHWKIAEPTENVPRGEWWKIFGDAVLNDLEDRATLENQNLQGGLARLMQARAVLQGTRSERLPQLSIGTGPMREHPSPASQGLAPDAKTKSFTLWRAQASVAYEPDLFGRVSHELDAASASAMQQEALYHSLQLAIQADLAQAYFSLRELDVLSSLYTDTVKLRAQSLDLFERRFKEGDISELELARARTELASAQAESIGISRQRAVAEHGLAILVGDNPSSFGLAPKSLTRTSLHIPPGLPSSLLERRPDIAAAEYGMTAANARIGVAKAAFFPRLSLTGNIGYESAELGDLLKWGSRAFLIGPLAGTMLTLPIFDGGARQAGVDQAQAVYSEEVSKYRQTVLQAFKDVEDNLAHLRLLHDQIQAQDEAAVSARRSATLSQIRYREGSVSYLDVIDANRSALQEERATVQLDAESALATVNLIRALGGGWSTRTEDSPPNLAINNEQ